MSDCFSGTKVIKLDSVLLPCGEWSRKGEH